MDTLDSATKSHLNMLLEKIEVQFDADGLGIVGPIRYGLDTLVRNAIESLASRTRRKKVVVVLDTVGGVVEVVERIVQVLRHHYTEVLFVVPDRAMSAGTVLVMAGDAIFMDYFSVLGPIDPQVDRNGQFVPALAYLTQYERLVAKAASGALTTAELVLLQKMDLAELQVFKEARELSVELLKKWLVAFKFKSWTQTNSGAAVDLPFKTRRAQEIAELLNKHERWHSHGRGISRDVLEQEVKVKVDHLESIGLSEVARAYVAVLIDYASARKLPLCVHTATFF